MAYGISVKPLGRMSSCLANPMGPLVSGTPADANALATTSFRAWCLARRPFANEGMRATSINLSATIFFQIFYSLGCKDYEG